MNMGSLQRALASSGEFYVTRSIVSGQQMMSVPSYGHYPPSLVMFSTFATGQQSLAGLNYSYPTPSSVAFSTSATAFGGYKHTGNKTLAKNDQRIKCYNGRWFAKINVPQKNMGLLIGARGATLRHIEESTGCSLRLPERGQELPVEVRSFNGQENVQRCLEKIEQLLDQGKSTVRFTHFAAFPCNHPDVVNSYTTFRDTILSSGVISSSLKDESLFTKPNRLHLTISMMWILEEADENKAKEVLDAAGKEIKTSLGNAPLTADIWGVSIMNDDPSNAHVLYANVSGEGVQLAANIVYKHMVAAGLSPKVRDDEVTAENPVKMHMTLANSRYKSQKMKLKREPFDASAVLEEFHDFYFGKIAMDRISICCMKSSAVGFYDELGSTALI